MSRDSSVSIASGYRLDGQGSISGRGRYVSLLHSVQTGSVVHPASYPWPVSLGVKRQGREADLTTPSSAEVKNGGAMFQLPYTSSWRGT
jgi:hypothetical protein